MVWRPAESSPSCQARQRGRHTPAAALPRVVPESIERLPVDRDAADDHRPAAAGGWSPGETCLSRGSEPRIPPQRGHDTPHPGGCVDSVLDRNVPSEAHIGSGTDRTAARLHGGPENAGRPATSAGQAEGSPRGTARRTLRDAPEWSTAGRGREGLRDTEPFSSPTPLMTLHTIRRLPHAARVVPGSWGAASEVVRANDAREVTDPIRVGSVRDTSPR